MSIVGDVGSILEALETRRPAVASHCRRVSAYAVHLARQYGLDEPTTEAIRVGGLLHDIGKLVVPANILSKPGRLTAHEWRTLQSHPEHGFEIAQRLGFGQAVTEIVLYHHERVDCSGYPDGLAGNAIPWPVRIVSVMDAFDALTSPRAYRDALSIDAARALLARESSEHYCAWVVNGLLSIPKRLLERVAAGESGDYRTDACPGAAALAAATTPWTSVCPNGLG